MILCVSSQRVFIVVVVVISLSSQSGNLWIHPRILKSFKNKEIKMYICVYLLTQTKSLTSQDRPILSTGRMPHDKTETVMTTTKIWSWVPEGARSQDGWTDCRRL